jgi:integrase
VAKENSIPEEIPLDQNQSEKTRLVDERRSSRKECCRSFASDRLKGKKPRVPNMLVGDHLRPAASEVIEIPSGHRVGFHNLRHALTSFLVEIGTDTKTIQDRLRWADPSILLKVYAHSRMDKRMEAQAKMIEAMGLNEKTAQRFIQYAWVINRG